MKRQWYSGKRRPLQELEILHLVISPLAVIWRARSLHFWGTHRLLEGARAPYVPGLTAVRASIHNSLSLALRLKFEIIDHPNDQVANLLYYVTECTTQRIPTPIYSAEFWKLWRIHWEMLDIGLSRRNIWTDLKLREIGFDRWYIPGYEALQNVLQKITFLVTRGASHFISRHLGFLSLRNA